MAVFRMKDPETWLPSWARGKTLPALKVKLGDTTYTIPPSEQHGGYEITVTDEKSITLLAVDPRFEQV